MSGNQPTNIQVYRKKWNFNIGIILFGAIFIYLAATILMYLTSNQVAAYEVREGSILKDNAYRALVLRDEMIVTADTDGYVNYFALEGSKVGVKTRVYSLSDEKLDFKDTQAEDTPELSVEEQASLLQKTQNFSDRFEEEQYQDVYTLKNTIQTMLENKSNQSKQAQLDAMAAEQPQGLAVYSAASDGIIVYSTDGFEGITKEDVTEKLFDKKDYQKKELSNNMKVHAGDPVYKLVRDDKWTAVILLSDEMAKQMKDRTSVKVRFAKDHETAVASFEMTQNKDGTFGFLTFENAMVRYAQDRFLDIELILEDESGLKIPKSSVTKKAFYLVPEDYLTQGGNNKEIGILIDTGKDHADFQNVDVYYRDQETGMIYLDETAFDSGTILCKPDSSDQFTMKETKTLKGVYNINKGYAEFKQVQILCESEEYYIVKSGNDYGLTNYDRIALNGKEVHENDVVFQ